MGTKFKCNQSGNIFEFFTDHDIKTMRAHSEYTEVKEEAPTPKEVVKDEEVEDSLEPMNVLDIPDSATTELKKPSRGRPRKEIK